MITAVDTKNKDLAPYQFKPTKTGHYVMALTPGVYDVTIDCDGYPSTRDKLTVFDLSSFQPETVKNYSFIPQEQQQPTPPPTNDKNKPKPQPPNRNH